MNMANHQYPQTKVSCRQFGSPVRWIVLLLITSTTISTPSVTAVENGRQQQGLRSRRISESNWMDGHEAEEKRDLQQCQSLSDIICETSIFESFCELLIESGRFDDLSGDFSLPNWTVFVPTNAALEDILDTIDQEDSSFLAASSNDTDTATLEDEWVDEDPLMDLLRFHLIRDQMMSGIDLVCNDTLVMSDGKEIKVSCDGGNGLYLTGSGNTNQPRVVVTDVVACNGIIHVIDGVLIHGIDEDASSNGDEEEDRSTTNTTVTVIGRLEPNQKPHQDDVERPIPDCQSLRNRFSGSCLRIGRFVDNMRSSIRQSNFGGSR